MARKKVQPAELALTFLLPTSGSAATSYIDLAQVCSAVNRRLYEQGKCYYVNRVTMTSTSTASTAVIATLPDTWVTANAHVKAHALWKSMQNRVLKDNPSVAGKWRDFKVYFDAAHQTAGEGANLFPRDLTSTEVKPGEWNMSTLVLPQHDVNPADGKVLAADEFEVHMLGDDTLSGTTFVSGAIIKMYQDTRARQNADPLVPGDMPTSWGTILTDSGSQDPELAAIIDAENDLPPYDNDEYVGGDGNFNGGVPQALMSTTTSLLVDKELGFKVPLGLLKIVSDGSAGTNLTIYLTPGHYKGVMATEVKQ